MIAGALAAVMTFGVVLWPKSRAALRAMLIPGDEEITSAAWNELVEDLQEGESFGAAFETFCREIIYAQ